MTLRPLLLARLLPALAVAVLVARPAAAAQVGATHPDERPSPAPHSQASPSDDAHMDPSAAASQSPTPAPSVHDRMRERYAGPAGQGPKGGPELREDTFRLIDAYVISNIQESLGLTDEQFGRVLPLVKKLQADRRDFARRRMQALRALRKSLNSGTATEAGVADLLKEVKSASADEHSGSQKNLDALDAILTPLQQAKYRVFEAEVELRLRHLLARSQDRATQGGK